MAKSISSTNPTRVAAILDVLQKTYPNAVCALHHKSAWQLLVATILSAQCTDVRVNLVTPALFRAFGDKSTLLLRAVERYALTYGAPKMAAFHAEPDIHKAVTGFCEATVNTATGDACGGCMMAAAALGQSERVTEIRSYLAQRLAEAADIFTKRFEKEIRAGRLTRTPSAKVRSRVLVDLLQGLQLRAKVGIAREQLLQDARSYVPLILGK